MKASSALSAPTRAKFSFVHTYASTEFSAANTRACGTSVARASAIAPLPVPRSTAIGCRGCRRRERVDRQLRDHLGLGTRDEHAGADAQFEMAERRRPGQVLKRLPGRAPRDQGFEPFGVRRAERVPAHGGGLDGSAADAQHVRGEELGIHLRVDDAGLGEALGGAAEGIGERERGGGNVRHERHPA